MAKPEDMFEELGLIQFAESSGQGGDENTRATQGIWDDKMNQLLAIDYVFGGQGHTLCSAFREG